ncbi:o-succinylbenzoate synthase [Psychroflexus halocasei]|uniref:O-succinylbenzoate synthase n=1 Tax=Psychroflexus halocasei TaxID=908615 RepID=A0A1H3ZTH8_9FLAO|nr:o-succinylbenzoate synthase [Psychroflexus halocasei]SEA26584.1 o-succinylbenzoate synthase [Psychroflexus halocasei]
MKATYKRHVLEFKKASGTSRGVLKTKETWFLKLQEGNQVGIGECGILRGLSVDDRPDYEEKLKWLCGHINKNKAELFAELKTYPSILFGLEMALKSLESSNPFKLFQTDFVNQNKGIPINGLIWMGTKEFMLEQIKEKMNAGFRCIKLKIGAIDFEKELDLLKFIRSNFSDEVLELRVDANGAFSPETAMDKLEALSQFNLHSIEQPIKAGQFEEMNKLCQKTALPIALDEELIGVFEEKDRGELLDQIQPQYIILKPSLVGGFKESLNWIKLAEERNIGWWITSALESNIGLNAIAQFTSTLDTKMPQGLGTGSLYINNITSPLEVKGDQIFYKQTQKWQKNIL